MNSQYQGRQGYEEILTEDGWKHQGWEQDKGCCSHAAEVAKGSPVEEKKWLSGVCPAWIASALCIVKSSVSVVK